MPVRSRVVVAIAFLILWTGTASALISRTPDEYVRRIWQTEEGLADPGIRNVLQSREGYIWVATDESVVRFDGLRFTTLDRRSLQARNDRSLVALTEGPDGSIWSSGCNGGLLRIKSSVVTYYSTNDGLPDAAILSACADRRGNVWLGTGKGLVRFRNEKFLLVTNGPAATQDAIRKIIETKDGSMLFAGASGLARHHNDSFTAVGTNGPVHESITALIEASDGALWIGTASGLSRLKDGAVQSFDESNGLAHHVVLSLYEDSAGNIWVGSEGGLQRLSDGRFHAVNTKDALSFEVGDSISDVVHSLAGDREGNIWVGSAAGLSRLKQQKFRTVTRDDGLGHNQITSIFQEQSGAVWIGTFGGGVSRISGSEVATFTREQGLAGNHVLAVFEDSDADIWIGTDGAGVSRFTEGEFIHYTTADGLPGNTVRAFCHDKDDNLWVAGNLGLARYQDGRFIDLVRILNVKTMVSDPRGSLWIGSKAGLTELRQGKTRTLGPKDGLAGQQVNAIYIDRDGVLWLGTELSGLTRYKDERFTTFATAEGPFEERVLAIVEDHLGTLWMGTRNGILSVSKRELNDFAAARVSSVTLVAYGKTDGLRRAQCNGMGQPAACRSQDGRLWFPTPHGAVMFNPEEVTGNRIAPPVVLEQVLVNGRPLEDWRSGQFPAGSGQIEFHYAGLSYDVPERVRFKYKLEGFDAEWRDAGTRRVAPYTNLRPGRYQFMVKACNSDGVWNEQPAELEFSSPPRFFETFYFYALAGIGVVSLGTGIWLLRVRSLKKRAQNLVKLVNARTKALQQEVADRKEAERRSLVFSRLGQRLSLAASQEQAAETIADAAEELLGWDACSVYSYDSDSNKGRPIVIYNLVNGRRANVMPAYADLDLTAVARRAIEKGAQLVNHNGQDTSRFSRDGEKPSGQPSRTHSLMYVPIRKGKYAVGVLSIQNKNSKAYTQKDLNTLQALGDYCGGAFERIRAEESLRETQQLILRQERLAAVGQLSAGVAHEFNNILTIIKGHANLLIESSNLPAETRGSVGQIAHSAERAANLTRQMLAFSRKQIMQPKVVDLNEVTTQVMKMLSRLIGENISLSCNTAPDLPAVQADAGMMEQIIMNLALNARDAMPRGGQIILSTSTERFTEQQVQGRSEAYAGHFVCLTVADTGIGMDEVTLARIFEPFFTTKEVGKGTGLGLSTVYGIVKQHHGWIEVASKKGQGTVFTIYLPAAAKEPLQSSQKIPALQVNGGTETILFVEDEPDIRSLARQVLERYGYRVLEAGTGVEALRVWEQNRESVALLLTDMVMPEGMTGRDLARQLQSANSKLKVIFTSGYSVETLEKDFMSEDAGFKFLPKPYQPQMLAQMIRDSLDGKN